MKNNIALIGFMGTGKSAVGQALARKIGWQFVEVDAVIEKMARKSIPDIFREEGEIAFRELEIKAVKKVAAGKNHVMACGGGVVLNTINIAILRSTGVLVLLTTSRSIILKRTSANPRSRPMLDGADIASRIKDLLTFRKPFYDRAADITVNTSKGSIEDIADAIIDELKCYESFSFEK